MRLLAGCIGVFALTGVAHAATEVANVKVNDTFVVAANGDNTKSGYVSAYRAQSPGPNGTVQYFVEYFIQTCDGGYPINTCDGANGFGLAPASAVQANATTARVNVNTSALAGFTNTVFHRVIDFSTGGMTETSNAGPGGVIDMSWRASGQYQHASSGRDETSFGSITFIATGTVEGKVAAAQGSILGTAFSAPLGDLGITRSVQLTIVRN